MHRFFRNRDGLPGLLQTFAAFPVHKSAVFFIHFHARHRTIRGFAFVPKHQFQMLPFRRQDFNGGLEYLFADNARARVLQSFRRGGIHRQNDHLRDGIPGCAADTGENGINDVSGHQDAINEHDANGEFDCGFSRRVRPSENRVLNRQNKATIAYSCFGC